MKEMIKRTGWIASRGIAAAALGWIGYAAVTWKRYGKATRVRRSDILLDRYIPTYEVAEQHEVYVAAPAAVTFDALRAMDPLASPIVRAIFRGRELLLGADHEEHRTAGGIVDQTLALGWRILAEDPGRELVIGAVTKPWESRVTFRGLSPDEFRDFCEPGYVKIVWTLVAEPIASDRSLAWTETRVMTTDSDSRARFRRYWAMFSPGILAIRHIGLRYARAHAERMVRQQLADMGMGPTRSRGART